MRARSLQRGGRMCVGGYRAFLVLLRVSESSLVSEGRVSDGGGVLEESYLIVEVDRS